MSKLIKKELLRSAITDAIMDRKSFADAYNNVGEEAKSAFDLIAEMSKLRGRTFPSLSDIEMKIANKIFIYAEQWQASLAEAQKEQTEIAKASALAKKYREIRLEIWGKTILEVICENPAAKIVVLGSNLKHQRIE